MNVTNEKEADQVPSLRPMISIAEVLERIPICRTTLDKMVKEGAFPKPYHLTPMKLRFLLDEVIEWQQRLIGEAGGAKQQR
ncbi:MULTISPECIES: AlpA family phage regulatory protein [unclassified Bradyrhizobium]|uniref:helix-turn-helix transcriptional regulator n=1 Tax=unclassified Bradyrhizobium TaxID=2631580 RepID=UPI00291608D0|nr:MULTISPECIES: AlpA family phage regulatory protein [unclassified Bradyrhizobium]